jgi:hypothetical protein
MEGRPGLVKEVKKGRYKSKRWVGFKKERKEYYLDEGREGRLV